MPIHRKRCRNCSCSMASIRFFLCSLLCVNCLSRSLYTIIFSNFLMLSAVVPISYILIFSPFLALSNILNDLFKRSSVFICSGNWVLYLSIAAWFESMYACTESSCPNPNHEFRQLMANSLGLFWRTCGLCNIFNASLCFPCAFSVPMYSLRNSVLRWSFR